MDLYPAIDLLGGRCVRLYQGDYDRETDYGDDPVAQALAFEADGRTVDPRRRPRRGADRRAVQPRGGGRDRAAVSVPVQTGGGVRDDAAAEALFDAGVARVVVGTAALEDPAFVRRLAARQPVAVGLDARGRDVAVRGWLEGSGADLLDLAAAFEDAGVAALVVTEISRDGTLGGPRRGRLTEVLAATVVPVIASGGVGTLADLEALAAVGAAGRRAVGGHRRAGALRGRVLRDRRGGGAARGVGS